MHKISERRNSRKNKIQMASRKTMNHQEKADEIIPTPHMSRFKSIIQRNMNSTLYFKGPSGAMVQSNYN